MEMKGITHSTTAVVIGIFIASLVLYIVTLAPDLLWGGGDFATFQVRAYLLEIEPGVFGHPLWVLLAHPFTRLPIRNVAWRANLASAIFAALALVFVFLSAWRLTQSRPASLLATGALAVSHTFWTYAVMPKVYSLNALLLAICIYLLLRWRETKRGWRLYLALIIYGISQFNHLVMATAAAGILVYIAIVMWQERGSVQIRRQPLTAIVIGLLSLAPYAWFLYDTHSAQETSGTVMRFLRGIGYLVTTPKALALGLGWGLSLLLYQFPLTTPIGFAGLYHLWKKRRQESWLLLLIVGGDLAFLLAAVDPQTGGDYVWNLHYYLQAYVVFALWIAAGLTWTWSRWLTSHRLCQIIAVALSLLLPIVVYAAAPVIARTGVGNVPGFRPLPGRDNFTYALSPWKCQETGAREFGERVMESVPENSIIFADYSIWAVLRYLQEVEGQRTDVTLVRLPYAGNHAQLPVIQKYQGQGELFLADTWRYYDMQDIQMQFTVEPWPPVYRLVPKASKK